MKIMLVLKKDDQLINHFIRTSAWINFSTSIAEVFITAFMFLRSSSFTSSFNS
jgi:hypothetical protein